MGIMKSWEAWSQKQWDNWGSKLDPTYKAIAKWGFTDKQNEALASILKALPTSAAAAILKIVDKSRTLSGQQFNLGYLTRLAEFVAKLLEFAKTK